MPEVTERSALELAAAIRRREVSAEDVVTAHIELLRGAASRLNAIAADRFDAARQEAADADARLAHGGDGEELPPLLGVPFTVKESIAVEGMPNAAGTLARADVRAPSSAPTVQRLRGAGAIPLGVTNTSELTLWIESDNPLYGRTNNPYNPRRSAGGSSGGEGAAVGSGGVPFGLGSDIAGSIRVPALFCGVFGHKPSAGLVPNSGMWPPTTGTAGLMLQQGPLARRAEDLMPILRLIAGPDGEDELVRNDAELGDPAAVSLEGLTVTAVEDSAVRPLSREMRDARERAAGALAAAGARLRSVSLPSWHAAAPAFLATLQARSGQPTGRTTIALLEAHGEAAPRWRDLVRSGRHTAFTRLSLAAEMLPAASERSRRRLLDRAEAIADELRDAIGDGVLLHPAHPRPAPRHGTTLGRLALLTPTAVFNLAGVPVTEVPLGFPPAGGLPVGIQVAAGLDRDHVSIAVALELERVFGGWQAPEKDGIAAGVGSSGSRR
jgi:fatty acid amide hydrolase 2